MKNSEDEARTGKSPTVFPGEMYCHTLTDSTILSKDLNQKGYHTLTFFGLDMPYARFTENNTETKKVVLAGYLKSINEYLAEPIEECLAIDVHGNPCIEAKSPVDLENELGMPEGNIFHDEVSWPFDDASAGTWGVETLHPRIFICGAGAKRGGGVSGIPGHNAAMAVLEHLGITTN